MAIYVLGTPCPICGKPIKQEERKVSLPPFCANRSSPLNAFNDAVFHLSCFESQPEAGEVHARLSELAAARNPWPPNCSISDLTVGDPDDYFGMGHLVAERDHPLHACNRRHFHQHCLKSWPKTEELVGLLNELSQSGAWEGPSLGNLIQQINRSKSET